MMNKSGIFRQLANRLGFSRKDVATADTVPESIPKNEASAISFVAAKYQIGQVVRHRLFPFRGVIFDVDPQFSNTDEWYEAIPEEVRPAKDQPYYHLFAENEKTHYVAYVSEQNLLPDDTRQPVSHPDIPELFEIDERGTYHLKHGSAN